MHHTPEPHYSFTTPSIHDDTPLDCRVYHPDILSRPQSQGSDAEKTWRKRGIVMAHPYAPMGGCYDDRVVGIVVEEFLSLGYVVGTFNFRGANGSKGRTSWLGKSELDDYISFAAFFMHYLSYLQPFPIPDANFTLKQSPISPQATIQPTLSRLPTTESAVVVLGGYSYGSLILKHLPPIPSIFQSFSAPTSGTAASEILMRARRLADQSNMDWINLVRDYEHQKRKSHEHNLCVTMGGEETSPEKRRSSREIRRSVDGVGNRIRSLSHRIRRDGTPRMPPEDSGSKLAITMPDVRYLLISPLTTPISTLAAPGLGQRFWSKGKEGSQEIIGNHISLAVYGDQDVFASAKKTREWAQKLSNESGSRFSSVEIAGAGHFWHENGVDGKLRSSLKEWEVGIR